MKQFISVTAALASAGLIYAAHAAEAPAVENNNEAPIIQTNKVVEKMPVCALVYYDTYSDSIPMHGKHRMTVHGGVCSAKSKSETWPLDVLQGWAIQPSSLHTTYRLTGRSIGDESKAVSAPVFDLNGGVSYELYAMAKRRHRAWLDVTADYKIVKDLNSHKATGEFNDGQVTIQLDRPDESHTLEVTSVDIIYSDGSTEQLKLTSGFAVSPSHIKCSYDTETYTINLGKMKL